jgi:hypothetical protein
MFTAPLQSTFCLTPPGDVPTRKGFFDAIGAGCIPVVFNNYSAHWQWRWNLGIQNALDTCIMIGNGLNNLHHNDVIQYLIDLQDNHPEVVQKKREAIARVASTLQYRLPESTEVLVQKGITPPRDAIDVIMDNVFRINANMEELVRRPRDRGDHCGVDKFKDQPYAIAGCG